MSITWSHVEPPVKAYNLHEHEPSMGKHDSLTYQRPVTPKTSRLAWTKSQPDPNDPDFVVLRRSVAAQEKRNATQRDYQRRLKAAKRNAANVDSTQPIDKANRSSIGRCCTE